MSRSRFIALLLVLGTLLLYLPVCHYPFINYDDDDYVTNWHAANWHPLTWLSLMADCQLFGSDAGALHAVNVLFHVANSVLLLLLLLRWTKVLGPSAFAAALFAWHPMHVESVAWISERKDVLSVFFALLALLSYTNYVTRDGWQLTRIKTAPKSVLSPVTCHLSTFYWLALLMFLLGLMSKPMLVTLPFAAAAGLLAAESNAEFGIRNSEFHKTAS